MSIGRTSLAIAVVLGGAVALWMAFGLNRQGPVAHCPLPPEGETDGPAGMIFIRGGSFSMGSEEFYADEAPVRRAEVGSFWIDRTEVTNRQFTEFVAATGYVTVAERGVEGVVPPGAAVFALPDDSRPEGRWLYREDANWRRPEGGGSSIEGREAYPVVQVAYEDALAYARWKGRSLPTEAQWEYAARGGLDGATYAWGDELTPDGTWRANNWQGLFPFYDEGADGFVGRAPVGCYPPNGYGLYDMIGNVWEWTRDPYDRTSGTGTPTGVMKGGSFLCAANYCGRYRPAARHPQELNLGTGHIGFRTVLNVPADAAETTAN